MMKSKSDDSSTTPTQKVVNKSGKSPKIKLLALSEKDKKLKRDNPAGPKGLPSHWGPKVRHKQRPGQQLQKKKAAKKGKAAQLRNGKKEGPGKDEGRKRGLEEKGEVLYDVL